MFRCEVKYAKYQLRSGKCPSVLLQGLDFKNIQMLQGADIPRVKFTALLLKTLLSTIFRYLRQTLNISPHSLLRKS